MSLARRSSRKSSRKSSRTSYPTSYTGHSCNWTLDGAFPGNTLRVGIEQGGVLYFQPGGMISKTTDVQLQLSAKNAIRKTIAGDSIMEVEATHVQSENDTISNNDSHIYIAPKHSDSICLVKLNHDAVTKLHIQRGHYFARSANTERCPIKSLSSSPEFLKNLKKKLVAGIDMFYTTISLKEDSQDKAVVALVSDGTIIRHEITPNSVYNVDNGNLVAWAEGISIQPQLAVSKKRWALVLG